MAIPTTIQNEAANVVATWVIELRCDCPKCGEYVDLLDDPDFWDGRQLTAAEHGTERSRDIEVMCPNCGHELKVDCFY